MPCSKLPSRNRQEQLNRLTHPQHSWSQLDLWPCHWEAEISTHPRAASQRKSLAPASWLPGCIAPAMKAEYKSSRTLDKLMQIDPCKKKFNSSLPVERWSMLMRLHGDGDHLLDAACAEVKFRQSFSSGVNHKVPHLVLGQWTIVLSNSWDRHSWQRVCCWLSLPRHLLQDAKLAKPFLANMCFRGIIDNGAHIALECSTPTLRDYWKRLHGEHSCIDYCFGRSGRPWRVIAICSSSSGVACYRRTCASVAASMNVAQRCGCHGIRVTACVVGACPVDGVFIVRPEASSTMLLSSKVCGHSLTWVKIAHKISVASGRAVSITHTEFRACGRGCCAQVCLSRQTVLTPLGAVCATIGATTNTTKVTATINRSYFVAVFLAANRLCFDTPSEHVTSNFQT